MKDRKAVKCTIDGTVIDSNRSIDFNDTVNMQNTGKLSKYGVFFWVLLGLNTGKYGSKRNSVYGHFHAVFLLTRINFMSPNLTRPIILVNFII